MGRLLEIGQDYIDGMKIRDVALLKICLLALGIMLVCKLFRLLCPCCHGEE